MIGAGDGDELIPISLVVHQVFCPRRAWLEAAGETTDSYAMAVGHSTHRRVDEPRGGVRAEVRGLDVSDSELGITGRCDVVRKGADEALTVVEFKATPVRHSPTVTEGMRVQLALQGLALESAGNTVTGYEIRFTSHKITAPVEITEEDRIAAVASVAATRRTTSSLTAPEPLEDDPRCMGCSHVGVCLPDERRLATVRRRIVVADPDTKVLHLTTPGARASLRRGQVLITHHKADPVSVPIERVQAIVVHGNSDLSSALLRESFWRAIPVVWCSGTGRVVGWAATARTPNGLQRVRQHEAAAAGRLDIAQAMVSAKIANQATLLRRNGSAPEAVRRLRQVQASALVADNLQILMGVEGEASAVYFGHFKTMLKPSWALWESRHGRGADDPVNVSLNVAYGVLLAECIRALVACGLDPHAGFLHSPNRNKPALALDLCEEFRPIVADSAVLRAFNNGEVRESDFTEVLGGMRMRDMGRKAIVTAMQQRLDTEIIHPTFGYRVTWRRAIEIQARLVLGVIDGSQSEYRGMRVR